MSDETKHWTERSVKDYRFRIAADFVTQLDSKLDILGWSQARLAKELGVTEGRVSQVLNNPGNLSLDLMVKCVRAVGMKLALVAYDDGDQDNLRGPINSEIFRVCWEKCGRPADFWAFDQFTAENVIKGSEFFNRISATLSGQPEYWSFDKQIASERDIRNLVIYDSEGDSAGVDRSFDLKNVA